MSKSESCNENNCDLPDIANEPHSGPNATLNWVGMSEIELPVHVLNGKGQQIQTVASVQAYVNLIDPNAKGIHMSRLYLAIDLQFFERRNSLISDNTGWKSYKTRISSSIRQGEISTELSIEIPYSSTCPCSAALARDIIQQGFQDKFGENSQVDFNDVHKWLGTTEGISATPHSQFQHSLIKWKMH